MSNTLAHSWKKPRSQARAHTSNIKQHQNQQQHFESPLKISDGCGIFLAKCSILLVCFFFLLSQICNSLILSVHDLPISNCERIANGWHGFETYGKALMLYIYTALHWGYEKTTCVRLKFDNNKKVICRWMLTATFAQYWEMTLISTIQLKL